MLISVQQREIGQYTVLSHCLGSGSFATVHLAIDTIKHRQVACKVIKPRMGDEVAKFRKEANLLKTLCHVSTHFVLTAEKTLIVWLAKYQQRL